MYDEPENDSNENDSNERQHIEVEIPVGTDATETLRDHNNEGSNRSRIMSLEEEKERRAHDLEFMKSTENAEVGSAAVATCAGGEEEEEACAEVPSAALQQQ